MCLSGGHLRLIAHYPFLVPMFPGPRYGTGLAFDVVLMGVGTSLDGHSASVHYCLSLSCYSPMCVLISCEWMSVLRFGLLSILNSVRKPVVALRPDAIFVREGCGSFRYNHSSWLRVRYTHLQDY